MEGYSSFRKIGRGEKGGTVALCTCSDMQYKTEGRTVESLWVKLRGKKRHSELIQCPGWWRRGHTNHCKAKGGEREILPDRAFSTL